MIDHSIIKKAILFYNKYHAPESKAKLIKINNEEIVVKFEGPFCLTCGVTDWIEDFKYVLEDLGLHADLHEVYDIEKYSGSSKIGVFRIKGKRKTRL